MKKKNREDHRVEGKIAIEKKIAIDRRKEKSKWRFPEESTMKRRIEAKKGVIDRKFDRFWRKGGGRGRKGRKSFGGEFRVSAAHRASKIPWPGRV